MLTQRGKRAIDASRAGHAGWRPASSLLAADLLREPAHRRPTEAAGAPARRGPGRVPRPARARYGLVAEQCSHRGASLYYGFLEDGCIRCPYHGWLYDTEGKCVEQPFEPAAVDCSSTPCGIPPTRSRSWPGCSSRTWARRTSARCCRGGTCWRGGRQAHGGRCGRWSATGCRPRRTRADFTHTYYLHAHNLKIRGLPGGEYYYRPFDQIWVPAVRVGPAEVLGVRRRAIPRSRGAIRLIFPTCSGSAAAASPTTGACRSTTPTRWSIR